MLTRDVEEILLETEKLKRLDIHQLLECPATGKWNVVQVLEHLNAYNRYYLNAIEAAMNQSSRKDISYFKSGILGDYFTKMMAPKQNGVVKNKM
ncbi:MAG: DinB family protein, partial [Chitinophagaceae bacterium]|nr:DinB family protein [Chitinophagaceae bacterium]